MERIDLGAVPHGEECAQVGTEGYEARALKECNNYKRQLIRLFEGNHAGRSFHSFDCFDLKLRVVGMAHDFGTYHEVVVEFDQDNAEAVEAAYWFESNSPEHWDEEAKRKLAL
jgi:hypothetical protein